MANNSQEPRKFDAVFGGQVPPPVNGAVLGGIKGLYQRFASLDEQVRLETLFLFLCVLCVLCGSLYKYCLH